MKTFFDDKVLPYTGRELAPLRNYLHYGLLGNSTVAWTGPCRVDISEMVDGEDVRAGSTIAGDSMLHFVTELFDVPLVAGVLLQRLFAEMLVRELVDHGVDIQKLRRSGDDVFYDNKKFNISIATRSINSVLVHVAVNIKNSGAPVPICALEDFQISTQKFAKNLLQKLEAEWTDILDATYKVRGVSR